MKNLLGSLIKQYENACSSYQSIQGDIRKLMADSITRSAARVLHREPTPDEKREFISNPEKLQQIYQNQLTAGASNKLVNCVSDLNERHLDIVRLERVSFS